MSANSLSTGRLSRRTMLGTSAALGAAAIPLAGGSAMAAPAGNDAAEETSAADRRYAGSTRAAVQFLQGVTDAYRTSGLRMAQSYFDGSGLLTTGFTYDNALTICALLAAGDERHARAIGDALLYAQDNDQAGDGRLRQAYFVDRNPPIPAGEPFYFYGTAVGDMSWAGIALAQLARATGARKYRDGAVRIAQWIQRTTYSTAGLGGYSFGLGADGSKIPNKSTEHDIDVYAFFRMVARLTGNAVWRTRAEHAWDFVERVWNAEDGFFWTGSDDGATINKTATQLPLGPQTWSWLAARKGAYAEALGWAATNLATTDTPLRPNSELTGNYSVTGVAFSSGSLLADPNTKIDPYHGNPDNAAVWFEGTAQLALALRDRDSGVSDRTGDRADARELLAAIRSAQGRLGQGQTFNGKRIQGGIVAASSPLQTGFGFGYYQHLHIGATSWFVMAALDANPYRFLR